MMSAGPAVAGVGELDTERPDRLEITDHLRP